MNGTRQRRLDCARSTTERPPEAPPRLRGELLRQSDSQTTEPRPGGSPRLPCHPPSADIVTPPEELGSPSLRNRRFLSALEAIDERRRYSRALFSRKAKNVFKEVVYTSVHACESSSHRLAATPNPSLKLTRYGRHCKPGLSHSHYCLSPGLQYLPPRAA